MKTQYKRASLIMAWAVLASLAVAWITPPSIPPVQAAPGIQGDQQPAQQATLTPSGEPLLPAVPTLAVPTPVPAEAHSAPVTLQGVSAVQRIRDEGGLRIGTLYNNPPMSSLSERGIVVGYEADLARAIAEDLGVDAQFVQVTRQNALAMLLAGDVDLLMASVVHRREYEADLAFSHTYFASGQQLLVRKDSDIQNVAGVSGRRIGVVQGTSSERTLGRALSLGELQATPQLYLTLDQAIGGLGSGEVDAILAERVQLLVLQSQVADVVLVPELLEPEPLAAAMRRNDLALRYLVDRALQRIAADGKLDGMRREWFPSVTFSLQIPVWEGVADDARGLNDIDPAGDVLAESVVSKVLAGQTIRIAGFWGAEQEAGGVNARLDGFYRALATEIGARWGAPVELIPDSVSNAVALVAAGQADLAIGVTPDWEGPYEVTYSQPLVMHGDRMMRPVNSTIEGYDDLRGGRWVGVFASEPGVADRVNELAESVRTAVNIFTIINDEDAVYSLTVEKNVDVVFGDSLRLIPQVAANPGLVELTERWYSTGYYTLAIPRRDPDLEALVAVTLQAIAADGLFEQWWAQYVSAGDPVEIEQWPGQQDQFMGVNVGPVTG